jgi:ankyrin repeat protein
MEDLFEQTNAIARKIYEDPTCPPVPFDIFTSAAVGNYDMISGIIKQRKDLNVLNKGGWSPLMYAAYMGHDNVLNLLLEAEADPNFCSEDKLSPLMIAAGCGNESICYFLLQFNAELNIQDRFGQTPLYHATKQGHQNCVRLLLESGADTEIREYDKGMTPLLEAAKDGHEIILETLIACNANVKAKTKDGHTARSLALKYNQMMIVSLVDNAQYVQNYAVWEESSEGTLDSQGSDILSGPKEFSRNYNPTQPSIDVLARRRSSATVQMLSKLPVSESPTGEGCPHLREFLQGLGLTKYIDIFVSEEIDFDTLLTFTEDSLKQIGITAFGPRRKIMMSLEKRREAEGNEKYKEVLKNVSELINSREMSKDAKLEKIMEKIKEIGFSH